MLLLRRLERAVAVQHPLGFDGARRQRVDPDVLRRVVDCHDLGKLDQRPLGGAIRRSAGRADAPHLRGDEDDGAAAALDHVGQHRAAQQKRAGQVDVEDPLPVGEAGFENCAARITRRRPADQDVEPAKFPQGRLGDREGVFFAGNVAGLRQRPSAGFGDEARGFFRRIRVDVAAGDRSAGLGKGERDRPANAAAGAADQCDLASEAHGLPPVLEFDLTTSPCRRRPRSSVR